MTTTSDPRNRWKHEPHIRFGDPCHDCGIAMTPASRYWSSFTVPEGMAKHGGHGLCQACKNKRLRKGTTYADE